MNTDIFTSICEEKAIRVSELALGRKKGIHLSIPRTAKIRHALSSLMTIVSSSVL